MAVQVNKSFSIPETAQSQKKTELINEKTSAHEKNVRAYFDVI